MLGKGKDLTAQSIGFSTKIAPQIIGNICRKYYKILFYVANVCFDAGEHGECVGTFLGSYRLEKPSKSAVLCIVFLITHYNRDLNTNGIVLSFFILLISGYLESLAREML